MTQYEQKRIIAALVATLKDEAWFNAHPTETWELRQKAVSVIRELQDENERLRDAAAGD